MEQSMVNYTNAIAWAAELHGDTRRKLWPAPLLAHLVAVSSLVLEDGGDQEQAIGAVLHDALVYGNCSVDSIKTRFGSRVAEIARFASDTREVFEEGPRPPWLERRQSHIASIESLSMDVLLVMAADKAQECQEWSLQLTQRPQSYQELPGGLEPLTWYYDALHSALNARRPESRSILILQRAVVDLSRQLAEQCQSSIELRSYPERHRAELFNKS